MIPEYKDYSFIFDIDGTLCPIKGRDEKYEDMVPFPDMVDKMLSLIHI